MSNLILKNWCCKGSEITIEIPTMTRDSRDLKTCPIGGMTGINGYCEKCGATFELQVAPIFIGNRKEATMKRWGLFYGMKLEHCQISHHRGIGYAFAKVKFDACGLDYVGYIGVQDIWFKNEGFEELLKGQGLEYVRTHYNIKIYKTQSNRPLHKIKKHLKMIAGKIKDHIERERQNKLGEMAICKKK